MQESSKKMRSQTAMVEIIYNIGYAMAGVNKMNEENSPDFVQLNYHLEISIKLANRMLIEDENTEEEC